MSMNTNIFGGMTLKALLENPDLQHAPAVLSGAPNSKAKKDGLVSGGEVDFTSAFLGPQLWEKPSYGTGNDFNLEYMDLDEFLCENGIPVVDPPNLDDLVASPPISPRGAEASPRHTMSPGLLSPGSVQVSPPPQSVVAPQVAILPSDPTHFLVQPKVEAVEETKKVMEARVGSPTAASPSSTPPVSPLPVRVEFSVSEQDIALTSIPGQGMFDPTAHNFTEDELKPQPMIKKSKKVFVPEDLKDDKYWARRRKNNYAAKRSRDARRIKENQIAMRASYLEKENSTLKDELEKARRDIVRLRHRLSKYEAAGSC